MSKVKGARKEEIYGGDGLSKKRWSMAGRKGVAPSFLSVREAR